VSTKNNLVRKEWSFFGLAFRAFLLLMFFNVRKPAAQTSEQRKRRAKLHLKWLDVEYF
jgi:hypothetical protein